MKIFITTFILTTVLLTGAVLVINFCRKRAARTSHGLTSMCHQTGESMCNSCASAMQKKPADKPSPA